MSITRCRSEPASGSVKSMDIVSPAHTRGIKRERWSSSPNSYKVSMQSCRDQMFSKPASAEAIISLMARVEGYGKFRPPKRRGMVTRVDDRFAVASLSPPPQLNAWRFEAHKACLAGGFEVFVGLACIAHAAVFAVGAFGVHLTRPFGSYASLPPKDRQHDSLRRVAFGSQSEFGKMVFAVMSPATSSTRL